jgi:hypothetical protein
MHGKTYGAKETLNIFEDATCQLEGNIHEKELYIKGKARGVY